MALDDYEGSVSLGSQDHIVVNTEEKEEEADVLLDHLDSTTSYKMETGLDKMTVMTNNHNYFHRDIKIKGQRLEEVENFKSLGAALS